MKQTSIYRHEHTVTSHVTSRLYFETKSKPFWHFAYITFNIDFFFLMKLQFVCFLMFFPIPFTVEQQHPQHTANTHLMHFLRRIYSALKQIASHGLSQLGIQCLAQCSKPERPGREREQEKERERENRTGKKGEGQFELEFGQSSNVFSGCLHGLIKSTPLAQGLVATRGGLWCLCHGFPAGQPPQPHSPPPTATHLMLTRCCDRKPVNKSKSCCFLICCFC